MKTVSDWQFGFWSAANGSLSFWGHFFLSGKRDKFDCTLLKLPFFSNCGHLKDCRSYYRTTLRMMYWLGTCYQYSPRFKLPVIYSSAKKEDQQPTRAFMSSVNNEALQPISVYEEWLMTFSSSSSYRLIDHSLFVAASWIGPSLPQYLHGRMVGRGSIRIMQQLNHKTGMNMR